MMMDRQLVVIGGGAAGMSAAVKAYDSGIRDILIIERNNYLGGVLEQCIHNGFGLHRFGEDLTGVEFSRRYRAMTEERDIEVMVNSFVIELSPSKMLKVVSPEKGLVNIQAKSVILAMGCRERTRNNLLIPGSRGAGILTAGTAQKYVNIDGYLPGKEVVILGSGDIGLIMARQFILEGVKVKAVVEIMPYSSGLPRNMKQCIEDFDIPVYFNSTVTDIHGKERVNSVMVARIDENRRPIAGTEFEIPCDTLMISAGLLPENELTEQAGIEISPDSHGAVVYDNYETSCSGIFSCGNVLHVHDLVDFVSEEAEEVGGFAAEYIKSGRTAVGGNYISLDAGPHVSGIVPQRIRLDKDRKSDVTLMFRPRGKFRDVEITAECGGITMYSKKAFALTPGEMYRMDLPAEAINDIKDHIIISIREGGDEQ